MDKLIIYHDSIGFCVTDSINYNSRIRNERRVTKCYDFETPAEIIEYYGKFFHMNENDFEIINRGINCNE